MSYYDKADLIYLMSGAAGKGGNGTSKVYSLKGDTDIVYNRGADLGATRIDKDGLIEKGRENLFTNSNGFNLGTGSAGWGKTSDTATNHTAVVSSGHTGYDGSSNAFKVLTEDTNNDSSGDQLCFVFQNVSTSGVQTLSAYVKGGNTNFVRVIALSGSGNVAVFYDLTGSGSVGYKQNEIDATITSVGSGWYRVTSTFEKPVHQVRFYVASGDGTTDSLEEQKATEGDFIFIQNAQLEKGMVATEYIDSGSSTGKAGLTIDEPRFNYPALGSGCPKLLMEQKRINHLIHSEYFGNSTYTVGGASLSANAAISPEGVKNAYELIENSADSNHQFNMVGQVNVAAGDTITYSVFVKANTRDYVRLRFDNDDNSPRMWVDLTDGSISAIDSTDSASGEVTELKNGWYRAALTLTCATARANCTPQIFIQKDSGNQTTYQGDGSSSIYIYGAQVEHGIHVGGADDGNKIDAPYATSYIPTYGTAVTRDQDGHTNPFLVNADADQLSFFVQTSQGEEVGSNRGPRLYHSTTDGTKDATCGYFINTAGNKVMFFDSNAGSGSDRNISKNFSTPVGEDHEDFKYLFCVDNIELRARLFVDGELFCDTARPTTSGATVRAMTERADFDKLRLTSSADVGEPDEITSVMTFDSSLSNTEGKILTGATNYVSFGAMTDALTNYTTYE